MWCVNKYWFIIQNVEVNFNFYWHKCFWKIIFFDLRTLPTTPYDAICIDATDSLYKMLFRSMPIKHYFLIDFFQNL